MRLSARRDPDCSTIAFVGNFRVGGWVAPAC